MKRIICLFISLLFMHTCFGNELTWGGVVTALGGQEAYSKLPIFNPEGVIRHNGEDKRLIGRILPEMMEKPIMRGKYGPRKHQIFIAFKWLDTQNNKLYATAICPWYLDKISSSANELPFVTVFSGERSVLSKYLFRFGEGYQIADTTTTEGLAISLEDFIRFIRGEVVNYSNKPTWKNLSQYNNDDSKSYLHPKSSARLFDEALDKDKDSFDPVLLDVEKSFCEKIIGYVLSEKEYNDLPILTDLTNNLCDSYTYTDRMSASVMRGSVGTNYLFGRPLDSNRVLILKLTDQYGKEQAIIINIDNPNDTRTTDYKNKCCDEDTCCSDKILSTFDKGFSLQSANIFFREALNERYGIVPFDMHDLVILRRLYKGETVIINHDGGCCGESIVHFVHLSKEHSSNKEKR